MKATLLFICILGLCMLVIPMIAMRTVVPAVTDNPGASAPAAGDAGEQRQVFGLPEATPAEPEASFDESTTPVLPQFAVEDVESFKILDEATGAVVTVPLRDFVRGAVAAEMPAAFHPEALKAQAVAAHTFALHNHLIQMENPEPALKGADFSADPSNMKVYITEETAREFYGDSADLYWSKICDAADSVMDEVLVYDGEPIVAAYHAISAGVTEDASNVWIGSAPYLVPAESSGDILAPNFESTEAFPAEEARKLLTVAYPDIELADDPAIWFGEPELSDSGYVLEIPVGDEIIPGKEIRTIFDLRSHHFEVNCAGGEIIFTVEGYGHGVGLSQYGADFMARQGATYDQILANYYTGAALTAPTTPAEPSQAA